MSWDWISEQAVPVVIVLLFVLGLQRGDIYTKHAYGLVKSRSEEYKSERDTAIDKLDTITREQAAAQADERAALLADIAKRDETIAMLEARLEQIESDPERPENRGRR